MSQESILRPQLWRFLKCDALALVFNFENVLSKSCPGSLLGLLLGIDDIFGQCAFEFAGAASWQGTPHLLPYASSALLLSKLSAA
jgi:hypothetical protein